MTDTRAVTLLLCSLLLLVLGGIGYRQWDAWLWKRTVLRRRKSRKGYLDA